LGKFTSDAELAGFPAKGLTFIDRTVVTALPFILQQTFPGRIHLLGSVCIRHLGETRWNLASLLSTGGKNSSGKRRVFWIASGPKHFWFSAVLKISITSSIVSAGIEFDHAVLGQGLTN
jgi:hypothetical protein